jgi:beta-1,4-mannosyl-glycoprotein beta-1,4-N-acetylglucosaminyltransferase
VLALTDTHQDLLDIYLATFYHVVDGIVIAEAAETYTRLPKPVFHESAVFQDRYSQFLPKMTPLTVHLPAGDPWVRERMSRHALLTKGLEQAGATEGDLVVIGDVDELPKPSVISALSRCNGWQHLLSGDRTVCLTSAFSYYSYEWSRGSPWFFPEVYLFYPGHPPTARKGSSGETCIASAGWHCSWCLPTVQDMQAKQLAYAHTEHALVRFTSEEHIVRQVLHGQDLAQRACCHSTRVPTAEMQVPDIVQDNPLCYPYLLDRRHGIVPGFVVANWTVT